MDREPNPRRYVRDQAVREFELFFRAMLPRAITAAFRVTGDRDSAEDAAVQALAKAYVRWRRLNDKSWREAWVMRVAINSAIDELPRTFALPKAEDERDLADDVALRHTLRAALRSLPRRQREVVALRYLVGIPEREVAEILDISHGTVKTHLRRGLTVLRRLVGPQAEEEHLAQLARD